VDLGAFRGAQDIDKPRVIISSHALQRFNEHLNSQPETENYKNLTKKQKGAFREKFGFSPEEMPDSLGEAAALIRKLLHYSTHENAFWKGQRVRAIFKYQEETFFLRNKRWQFRIVHSKENPDCFILKTIVWLDDFRYSSCLKK